MDHSQYKISNGRWRIGPAIPGVGQVGSADSEGTGANTVAANAVVLDLARVKAASGLTRGVTVDDGGDDVVGVHASAGDRVGDNEATLGVTAKSDLGVRAVGLGLRDEVGHDGTTLTALLDVAGNGGFVVDTLNGDAVGTERGLQGLCNCRADGAAEVLRVEVSFV